MIPRCLGLLLCTATACGSVQEAPDASEGDFALSVAPAMLDIPIASSRVVTLTVERTAMARDIALTAQDLPPGLAVTFAPSTLGAGESTSQVTISVAGGTAAMTSSITLAGTAGDVERTALLEVSTTTITVAGRIQGGRAGVTVRIVGKPPATSDAAGNFVFTDVTPPYDVYTTGTERVPSSPSFPAVVYYRGLTRSDPEIAPPQVIDVTTTPLSHARVNGTKTGGDEINERLIAWSTGGSSRGAGSSYDVAVSWPQAASRVGTLYGLQWTKRGNGAPDTFIGYGARTETLAEGSTRTLDLSLTAPGMATLTGTVTPPPGFPAPSMQLQQQFGDVFHSLWAPQAETTVAATIPLIGAGRSTFYATSVVGVEPDRSSTQWVYPGLAASTDVSVALPAPPALTAPAAAAANVTTATPFEFTSAPSTVHVVRIATTGATRALYTIYTTETTFTLPVIPELPLPPNQTYTWSVRGYGPHAHLDDVATALGVRAASPYEFEPMPPRYSTTSVTHSFTSAP